MISRIRIEAIGETGADVEKTLEDAAYRVVREVVGRSCSVGEMHLERDTGEPEGRFAWKGRLLLYADVSDPELHEDDPPRINGKPVDEVLVRTDEGVEIKAPGVSSLHAQEAKLVAERVAEAAGSVR